MAGGVDVAWRPGLVSVKGRVEIPRAEIKLSELPPGAVAVSEDVVVINRVEVRPGGTRLEVDLEVVLQDHVHFTAFGLDTGLTGTLRLRRRRHRATLTLIDGSFAVYGQKLAIESGRLTYSGRHRTLMSMPALPRTIREPTRTVTVGAHSGPALPSRRRYLTPHVRGGDAGLSRVGAPAEFGHGARRQQRNGRGDRAGS
jgi:autotransporter translocation and assembly factor TamB